MRKQTPRTAAAPVPGAPSFENTSWTDDCEIVPPADLAMSPNRNPDTAIATHQPMTVGRAIRTARPEGPERNRTWGWLVARSGTMLAPTSRAPARYTVVNANTAVNPVIGRRAKGWGLVSGWSSST